MRRKIFFAGHLRPFKHVGRHPQFEHIHDPPPGYEFVTSAPTSSRKYARTIKSIIRFSREALANGSSIKDLSRFIRSRSLRAQMSYPDTALAFLPSMPFILGQTPWIIEIEDTTTLFVPFPRINGKRVYPRLLGLDGIYTSGFFPSVKALLESDSCRGIICHVRSTAESLPILFGSPKLAAKISHIPMGIRPWRSVKLKASSDTVTILFTNSWHQGATSFYLRGGLDVLEAYSNLYSEGARVRLIIRSKLPEDLDSRYRQIIERCKVEVIEKFLPANEIEALFNSADIYVLPAARLHVLSILQAMSAGLAIVTSDGWGITEYVKHGTNGLVVGGRYGITSWMDDKGMLRENLKLMFSADLAVTNGLTGALSTLVSCEPMRRQLGEVARKHIETRYSIENWNSGLAKAFDRALSK